MSEKTIDRRGFLTHGLAGFSLAATAPHFLSLSSRVFADAGGGLDARVLVVLQLSGGNDGLSTVVPYADDAYYRARRQTAVAQKDVLKLNDYVGFHPTLKKAEALFKDGRLAIVQGASYPNPNRSHFESMRFWHTGVPNAPESRGWLGRFADAYQPEPVSSYIVNIAKEQSAAVNAGVHSPVVFDDPERFVRQGSDDQKALFAELSRRNEIEWNDSLNFVRSIASTADESSEFIRHACAEYKTRADYG
ncbi:MAG: hypothetical protein O7E54_12345, partial [Planctomycetota bacterium]|nr:hypothetical protein [Planctomycetota bacterium]